MSVRPFDWRDFASLHRYRHDTVFLDSGLVLTRGPLLVPGAIFSFLMPGMGVFTAVSQNDNKEGPTIIGQIMHVLGSSFAHLTFVTPEEAFDTPALPELLEYMIAFSGRRGALRLLADVDEKTGTYEVLRKASFAIYTRQRIWQLTRQVKSKTPSSKWRQATRQDALAIRLLYNNLVPGLVQQIEPFSTNQRPRGLVYQQGEDLLAFVELRYGHRGIWAQPFVHPDTQDIVEHFFDLLHALANRGGRPVYICIRSYQAWLEPAVEELGAEAGSRQAVMVKNMASLQKAFQAYTVPVLEGGQPEATTSIVNTESYSQPGGINFVESQR